MTTSPRPPTDSPSGARPPELGRLLRSVAADTRSVLVLARACSERMDDRLGEEAVRSGLCDLLREATSRVDSSLQRLERFAVPPPPPAEAVDVAALLSRLLDGRWEDLMERDVLLLKELEEPLPPLIADPARLARALDAVLAIVVCAVASGGDVHVAACGGGEPAPGEPSGLRLLLHFPVDRRIWDVERLSETLTAAELLREIGADLGLHVTDDRVATLFVTLSSAPRRA